jgi:hypothetical protein
MENIFLRNKLNKSFCTHTRSYVQQKLHEFHSVPQNGSLLPLFKTTQSFGVIQYFKTDALQVVRACSFLLPQIQFTAIIWAHGGSHKFIAMNDDISCSEDGIKVSIKECILNAGIVFGFYMHLD